MLTFLDSDCGVFDIYLGNGTSLINGDIGCADINGMVEGPHNFEVCGNKTWRFLLEGYPVSVLPF